MKDMRQKVLLISVVWLLCCSVGFAQNDSTVTNIERALGVTHVFSKEFVLPDVYIMNTFSFDLYYTVYQRRSVRVTDCKYTSSITRHGTGGADELTPAILSWFSANDDILLETLGDSVAEDSVQLVARVYYSPFLYAQPGDTLFCTGELVNEYLSKGEEAATYYDYYIRNRRNTPYYALIRRNKNHVTLLVHNSETGKSVNVVSYYIQSIDRVDKSGNQIYLGDDGKSLRIKQVWNDNQMLSAELYNSENRVAARYEFQYITFYPKLKTIERLYPDGSVQQRTVYDRDEVQVTAFNEDGSKAKYLPARNVEKAFKSYFKKNFRAPAIGRENDGINHFLLKVTISCAIDENGNIRIITYDTPQAEWEYNYNKDLINSNRINRMVKEKYGPYFDEFWQELREQSFTCTPAKVNGTPVPSTATITIEHWFTPRL